MTAEGRPIGAGLPETPDRDGAFPILDADQRARLRDLGRIRAVEPGEVIVQGYGEENRVIAVHGPQRFRGQVAE